MLSFIVIVFLQAQTKLSCIIKNSAEVVLRHHAQQLPASLYEPNGKPILLFFVSTSKYVRNAVVHHLRVLIIKINTRIINAFFTFNNNEAKVLSTDMAIHNRRTTIHE
jgi:hypothetical protein